MSLEVVVTKEHPMFQMLYHQCPTRAEGASHTFHFELCDSVMEIVAELHTDAQDIDVLSYVITKFSFHAGAI